MTYPRNRDRIVVDELLSRGPLSADELQTVVVGRFDKGDYQSGLAVNNRSNMFLGAVQARKELAAYAPALEHLFLTTKIHPAASFVIGGVFGSMERDQVDFTHAALAFLDQGLFIRASLFYLEQNVTDEETVQKLSKIAMKPELEPEREKAVKLMRDRLANNRRLRPLPIAQ